MRPGILLLIVLFFASRPSNATTIAPATSCPLTAVVKTPKCNPILIDDNQQVGEVCATVVDDNLEIEKTITKPGCCLTEWHICNVPSKAFELEACVKKYMTFIEIDMVYEFVCGFVEDEYMVAGHATIQCDVENGGAENNVRRLNSDADVSSHSAYFEIPLECTCDR